ncbi:hypothetical protein, partial [Klebsiella aerogenes]|uniref:hypothetical protein n=1 Tax=Klebsiella aerogenes TaxID=548 RepID=UPI001D18A6A6
ELAMKRREEMGLPAWLQIHVIELPVDRSQPRNGRTYPLFYREKDRIMTEVIKAVELGEKIMLATDSSTFCRRRYRHAAPALPGKEIPLRKPEEQAGTRGRRIYQ